MCVTIYDQKNNEEYETVRQLARLLGSPEQIKWQKDYFSPADIATIFSDVDEDSCLCPVALEDTLKLAGIPFRVDPDDSFNVYINHHP